MKQPTFGHQSWGISESFVTQVSLVLNNCHQQFALLGSNKKKNSFDSQINFG